MGFAAIKTIMSDGALYYSGRSDDKAIELMIAACNVSASSENDLGATPVSICVGQCLVMKGRTLQSHANDATVPA